MCPLDLTIGSLTPVFWAEQFSVSEYRSRQIKTVSKKMYKVQPTGTGNFEEKQSTNA